MKVTNVYFIILAAYFTIAACNARDNVLKRGVLLEMPVKSAQCGIVSSLIAFKFRDLNSRKEFVLFIPCPELYGENYFLKGQVYCFDTVKDKSVYNGYVLSNKYEDEKLISYYVD